MKFILEIWPDRDDDPDLVSLIHSAIESVRENGEELSWEVHDDDGTILTEGLVPGYDRTT